MALAPNTWSSITFEDFSDASWTGLSTPPALASNLMKAILAGDPITVWLISVSTSVTFAFDGGSAVVPASVIASDAVQTGVQVTDGFGATIEIVKDPNRAGGTMWFNALFNTMQFFDAAATTDINTITS